jgi:hypothetical protein
MQLLTKSKNIKTLTEQDNKKETLSFYLHHLEQLDKLFKVIDLLKKENKQLRQMLKNNTVENVPDMDPAGHAKPKITCWKFEKEE